MLLTGSLHSAKVLAFRFSSNGQFSWIESINFFFNTMMSLCFFLRMDSVFNIPFSEEDGSSQLPSGLYCPVLHTACVWCVLSGVLKCISYMIPMAFLLGLCFVFFHVLHFYGKISTLLFHHLALIWLGVGP